MGGAGVRAFALTGILALLAGGAPVSADDTDPTTTSVPVTTTSTTVAGADATGEPDVTVVPPSGEAPSPPVQPATVEDEASEEQVTLDETPPPAVLVGPPLVPGPPSTEQQGLQAAIAARLEQARLGWMLAAGLESLAVADVVAAGAEVEAARTRLEHLGEAERRAAEDLSRQGRRVRRWAIEAYTGGTLRPAAYVLDSDDINDIPRRLGLASAAFGALDRNMHDQEAVLGRVVGAYRTAEASRASAEARLATAQEVAAEATLQAAKRLEEVAALDAGQIVTVGGVAFPVAGPNRFSDTFGAPRMAGTAYVHSHQGVDIFAEPGTPVVAFERGAVVRIGTDVLGGTKLWLMGQSGARYYYAHLQAYAPGLAEGQIVEAGQTLAFVGNTGNALHTSHHLHFEIHPDGPPAVNPYPLLVQIAEAAHLGAAAPVPPLPPSPAGTVVGGG